MADLLGSPVAQVELLDSAVTEVAYDLPAITTGGRYVRRGPAAVAGRTTPYPMFVKLVQSWSRSPLFAFVPEEIREVAEATVPWRTEPLAYRSDLATRLPDGLTMPRALGVVDLDEKSAAIWLEQLDVRHRPCGRREVRAGGVPPRAAGRPPRVAALARVGRLAWTMLDYAFGRLANQVVPMVHDDGIWAHPLVAVTFDHELRERMRAAADRAPAYAEELDTLPKVTGHGDASPNNLLAHPAGSEGFALIDYGFWMPKPVGADLGQLVVGDIQIGKLPAGDLAARDDAHLAAYRAGAARRGMRHTGAVVRRAHALHLLLIRGLSAVPDELLDRDRFDPEVVTQATDRAEIARFSLDRLEATA